MITESERKYILDSLMRLLDEYDYNYTLHALNDIIDEWANKKSTLIEAFKQHPNYVDGKFLIAFNCDFHRDFDKDAVLSFYKWLECQCMMEMVDSLPEDINIKRINDECAWLPDGLFRFLADMDDWAKERTISEELAQEIDKVLPQIHPHAGQKTSRVVNKICAYLNYDKHPDYNREFAKFADGLNPLTIKRHTVLSINPLDYLTMSFGNSWASCHTIDKNNKRRMPNDYSGCYSSGTISYMLDESSMVFYTVDSKYDSDDYWSQPKINRQMFHYGEDKLVQGRLYPQSNDDDDNGGYTQYRNIVQEIMSIIFDFPNIWTLRKGSRAASEYIYSRGTHYRDYENFDNCSLSTIKGVDNDRTFNVGACPICVNCGERHDVEHNINCCVDKRVCVCCGRLIHEDDGHCVGDQFYCDDCVTYCDECGYYEPNDRVRYIDNLNIHVCEDCLDDYYYYCDRCGQYHRIGNEHYLENLNIYVCPYCFEDYIQCDECGDYQRISDMYEKDGEYYCEDCYKEEDEDVSEDM